MQSPVHPHIEAFYKAFPIFKNLNVDINECVYTHQTYRIEETVKQAEDLIFRLQLSLEVKFCKVTHTIRVLVIPEIDRKINFWGNVSERLTELQKQL